MSDSDNEEDIDIANTNNDLIETEAPPNKKQKINSKTSKSESKSESKSNSSSSQDSKNPKSKPYVPKKMKSQHLVDLKR